MEEETKEDITVDEFLSKLTPEERSAVVSFVRDLRNAPESAGEYDAPWVVALRRAPGACLCIDGECGLSGGRAHVGPCERCPCPKEHAIEECPVVRGESVECSHVYLMRSGTGLRCQHCEEFLECGCSKLPPMAVVRKDGTTLWMGESTFNEPKVQDLGVDCFNCKNQILGDPTRLYARSDNDEMIWVCRWCIDMRPIGLELRELPFYRWTSESLTGDDWPPWVKEARAKETIQVVGPEANLVVNEYHCDVTPESDCCIALDRGMFRYPVVPGSPS